MKTANTCLLYLTAKNSEAKKCLLKYIVIKRYRVTDIHYWFHETKSLFHQFLVQI